MWDSMETEEIRKKYSKIELNEKTMSKDPFEQFDIWYKEVLNSGISEPNAMVTATADSEGIPTVRTVLLKSYDNRGFVFFTNYNSKKGSQLSSNHSCALLFYWPEPGRQVRIEGNAEKVTEEESLSYFKTRPRESQLSACASEQSAVIPDRQHLERRYDFYRNIFTDKPVEKPQHWGGYRLVPDWFEFWNERDFRLHDRLTYTKCKDIWVIERLAP